MNKNTKNQKSKRIGFTCGSFDLCHTGHMIMFGEVKRRCDYLIVALQEDPSKDRNWKNKPILSMSERLIMLNGIKYIDEITTYKTEKDLYNLLLEFKPDIRFIGPDWKDKEYTGKDIPGIRVVFNSRDHHYSTSNLRKRVYEAEKQRMLTQPITHNEDQA